MSKCWSIALVVMLSILLAGCSAFVDGDQTVVESGLEGTLGVSEKLGQTFVARHAGLTGMDIWLQPALGMQGEITLHLRDDPKATDDRASASMPLEQVKTPGFYRFSFAPQRDSHGRYYYAFLESSASDALRIGTARAKAYLDGSLYRDHEPIDSQMAFRLAYSPREILGDLALAGLAGLGLLLATILLYVVPGWAVLVLTRFIRSRVRILHWAEGLGVAIGVSLIIYPLLLLWTNVARIHLGPLVGWLPATGGLLVLTWHFRPWRWRWTRFRADLSKWCRAPAFWPDVTLLALIVVAGAGRALAVRSLEMPLWADSVQHATMVQRILESGGLFQSWEPYAPYRTLAQQFGFHADVAAWAWVTGMGAPQAMIWAGQMLNVLAVLTLYPLAYRIKGPWAGVTAVLVAGVFLMFPAYYTNWGRYPQMAGQAVLPVAAWWFWICWRDEGDWRAADILIGASLVAGTFLSYYRMAFNFLAFVCASVLLVPDPLRRFFRKRNGLALAFFGLAVGILVFPWIVNIASGHALTGEEESAAAPPSSIGFWQGLQGITIGWVAPQALVILLGILVGVWGGGGAAALPVVWLWVLVLLPVLRLVPLPGVGIIQEFTIQTSLYIPLALIWGTVAGYLADLVRIRDRWKLSALVGALALMIGIARLPAMLRVIDRDYDLSTRPDMRAAQWIRGALPDNAFFLINGIVYTDGVSAIGGDGGWWLPLLTRRGVTVPPQYALTAEQPSEPGYSEAVNSLVRELTATSVTTPEGISAVCRFPRPITHVYLGQREGMVDKALPHKPSQPMLSAELLMQHPAFRLVYHQDHVMIFEFDRSRCPPLTFTRS